MRIQEVTWRELEIIATHALRLYTSCYDNTCTISRSSVDYIV